MTCELGELTLEDFASTILRKVEAGTDVELDLVSKFDPSTNHNQSLAYINWQVPDSYNDFSPFERAYDLYVAPAIDNLIRNLNAGASKVYRLDETRVPGVAADSKLSVFTSDNLCIRLNTWRVEDGTAMLIEIGVNVSPDCN